MVAVRAANVVSPVRSVFSPCIGTVGSSLLYSQQQAFTSGFVESLTSSPKVALAFAASASLVLAVVALLCRGGGTQRPPFEWAVMHEECAAEFTLGGKWHETVEKVGDYKMPGWVIPVNGRIEMSAGSVYRWALDMEQMNRERPEIQFGIQGSDFEHPWRLITTTRCSRSRDEEDAWTPRPGGDLRIQERDIVHIELDFTGSLGVLSMSVNDGPFEIVYDEIPTDRPVMPAVMLGGNSSRVRVQATKRSAKEKCLTTVPR